MQHFVLIKIFRWNQLGVCDTNEKEYRRINITTYVFTSWDEKGFVRDENDETKEGKVKTCWKGYSFDVINELTDKNYLYYSKGKSITLTHEGEAQARKLMDKYLK